MTDREVYRSAFSLRAPREPVRRAVEQAASQRKRGKGKLLMAAVLAAVLLVTTAGAELNSGAVTNLLAPLFGSARTELLEEVGRPVNASVSADGYTITAQAVAGDRHKLLLVYSVVREDGQPIPEGVHFFHRDDNLITGRGGSIFSQWEFDPEDPSHATYYEIYTVGKFIPRTVKISLFQLFSELEEREGKTQPVVLAEGPWELSFTRRYPDTTLEIPAKGITFTDKAGRRYTISSLSVSPFGFYVSGTSPYEGKEPGVFDLTASAVRTDGSSVTLDDDSLGCSVMENQPYQFRWQAYYKNGSNITLISPNDIESVTLCDTTIPLH